MNLVTKRFLHPDNINEIREILLESRRIFRNKIILADSDNEPVDYLSIYHLHRCDHALNQLEDDNEKAFALDDFIVHQTLHSRLYQFSKRIYNIFIESIKEADRTPIDVADFGLAIARLFEQLEKAGF